MAKKKGRDRDVGSAGPKQLRKRLRKAEDQLQDAQTKRDRAQARVEALSIIADEIRAQLAEIEQADKDAVPESGTPKATGEAGPEVRPDASKSREAPAVSKSVAKPKPVAKPRPTAKPKPPAKPKPAPVAKPKPKPRAKSKATDEAASSPAPEASSTP